MTTTALRSAASVPALLRARREDGGIAHRVKRLGLWKEISWRDYWQHVSSMAAWLIGQDVRPGDRVALLGENSPEWLVSDLAIQSTGAISVGVYATSSPEQLEYCLNHSDVCGLILEDAEQLEKWLAISDRCPQVRFVAVMEKEPLGGVWQWQELLGRGAELLAASPALVSDRIDALGHGDTALFIYTSGTTGAPKAAMLTHGNLLWAVDSLAAAVGVSGDDEFISFLPLSHIVERLISVVVPLFFGYPVSFTENLDTVMTNMQEIRPTIFFAVPRIWEKMYSLVELGIRDAHVLKQLAYRWAVTRARAGGSGPAPLLAHLLVLRFLRVRLGLDRVRVAISGAAPISPGILRYFRAIGVDVREGFGLTESTGIIAIHRRNGKLGTVGPAFPGVEIRLADDGEIMSRSPGNFRGYWRDEEATADVLKDGWLHTGDIGELDTEGNLSITDRKKDIIITAGGKNIAPQKIENQLKSSVFINDAVVIGDRRRYLVALIVLDEDNITKWAADEQLPYTTYSDLAAHADVRKLIEAEVEAVNATLARVETIKEFAILSKRLYHEDGEVTATLKVRRASLEAQYAPLIESMY